MKDSIISEMTSSSFPWMLSFDAIENLINLDAQVWLIKIAERAIIARSFSQAEIISQALYRVADIDLWRRASLILLQGISLPALQAD